MLDAAGEGVIGTALPAHTAADGVPVAVNMAVNAAAELPSNLFRLPSNLFRLPSDPFRLPSAAACHRGARPRAGSAAASRMERDSALRRVSATGRARERRAAE